MAEIQNNWQYQLLMKMQNNHHFHLFLVGMQNGTATLEDNLAVSYKMNTVLPYNPAICLTRYLAN